MKKVKKSILLEDELIDEVLRKFISCTKNIIPRPVKEHVLHKKCTVKKIGMNVLSIFGKICVLKKLT